LFEADVISPKQGMREKVNYLQAHEILAKHTSVCSAWIPAGNGTYRV